MPESKMPGEWALEASADELLTEFLRLRDNEKNSKFGHHGHSVRQLSLRKILGIIIARLDKQEPPFKRGQLLVCTNPKGSNPVYNPGGEPWSTDHLEFVNKFRVSDLTYDSRHGWIFSRINISDFLMWKASDFELVEEPALSTSP